MAKIFANFKAWDSPEQLEPVVCATSFGWILGENARQKCDSVGKIPSRGTLIEEP